MKRVSWLAPVIIITGLLLSNCSVPGPNPPAGSSDANLADLTLSAGTLNPAFSADTTAYTASVGHDTNFLAVTAVKKNAQATIRVRINNGVYAIVESGNPSAAFNLGVGVNLIDIQVTAQDASTKTYTISATRAGSGNARLSALVVSNGILNPVFSSATNTYSVSVGNAVTSITVTPTAEDANSTIQVRINEGSYTGAVSGAASNNLPLDVGSNLVDILVTAQDGSLNVYSVTVTRAGSSNALLSGLTISAGTLSPVFVSGTNAYSVSVGNTVTGIAVTPTKADANATIQVRMNDGTYAVVASGSISGNLGLNVGNNLIEILVTAQDNSTNSYTISVTRAGSSNANLAGLAISSGTLAPAFSPSSHAYSASVANAITDIMVTPIKQDAAATIQVRVNSGTWSPVASGSASGNLGLNVGGNLIEILVTAQDLSTNAYTISVTRAGSSNANLISLNISTGTLNPTFSSGTTSYTVSVAHAISGVTITAAKEDLNAAIHVNGMATTSGQASPMVNLAVGSNLIEVLVTAQDGSTKTYSITVTRAVLPPPANVSASDGLGGIIQINWNAVSDAIEYQVFRSFEPETNYTEIAVTPNINYADRIIDIGITYYYRIRAKSGSGDYSDFSSSDSGFCSLPAPADILSLPGLYDDRIVISWTAVQSAERYYVFRSDSESGTYAEIGNSTQTSFTDLTGLIGWRYFYKVKAWSSVFGYSDFSPSTDGSRSFGYPLNVTASKGLYYDRIAVTWYAVTGADLYHIIRSTYPDFSTYQELGTTNALIFNDTTASREYKYYYRVTASSSHGLHSGYNVNQYGTGYKAYFPAPAGFSASQGTYANSIRLTWSTVSGATGYQIIRFDDLNNAFMLQAVIPSGSTSSFIDSNEIIAGKTYRYKIVATISSTSPSYGYGEYSAEATGYSR